jgi:hypothetical protein
LDAQPTPGGGEDTETAEGEGDAIPDLLLKHSDATLATYV